MVAVLASQHHLCSQDTDFLELFSVQSLLTSSFRAALSTVSTV